MCNFSDFFYYNDIHKNLVWKFLKVKFCCWCCRFVFFFTKCFTISYDVNNDGHDHHDYFINSSFYDYKGHMTVHLYTLTWYHLTLLWKEAAYLSLRIYQVFQDAKKAKPLSLEMRASCKRFSHAAAANDDYDTFTEKFILCLYLYLWWWLLLLFYRF